MDRHKTDPVTRCAFQEQSPHYVGMIEVGAAPVLPDIITMIQSETNLTRKMISRILAESSRLAEFALNPQAYITAVTSIIKTPLNTCLLDGLRYEQLDEDRGWQARELSVHAPASVESDFLFTPTNQKTVYDRVPTDSSTEMQFVKQLNAIDNVKLYIKLPSWFKVDTPVGAYNPDWAILYEDGKSFSLVRETKSTMNEQDRRGTENDKIKAARAHYQAIGVDYGVATTWMDVVRSLESD